MATVGSKPPETGAKAFGPSERLGIDTIEFDEGGSTRASGAMYSPDVEWGVERCNYWIQQDELKLWTCDVHSHPGGMNHPSGKSGVGLGDLGYVEQVFAQNEWCQEFFVPIVTYPGTSRVQITPWYVHRDEPLRPIETKLVVCSVDDFPERIFNPAWEEAEAAEPQPFDIEHLLNLITPLSRRVIVRKNQELQIELFLSFGGLVVSLPQDFPKAAPRLCVRWHDEEPVNFKLPWMKTNRSGTERRIASMLQRTAVWARRQY